MINYTSCIFRKAVFLLKFNTSIPYYRTVFLLRLGIILEEMRYYLYEYFKTKISVITRLRTFMYLQ